MATIRARKRKDGTTAYTVRWRENRNGTETSETFDSRDDADMLCDYLNANGQSYALATEAYKQSRAHGPTLAEMIAVHLKGLTGVTERTRHDYERDGRLHILPHLGHIRAGQLTRAHVKGWVNKLAAEGIAPKSISNYHGLLSAVMATAIDTGTRTDNPCKGIRLPQRDRRGNRDMFLEPEEYQLLLAQFPDRWKAVVELLARTGMRWGEATALEVRDVIDADVPYIIINKAWKRDNRNGYYIDRPKTARSNREVTIDPNLFAQLSGISAGRKPTDTLLVNDAGLPLMHRPFFRDVWKPAVDKAMERRDDNPAPLRVRPKIHGLRHSHGSWLVAAGVDLPTVQARLGHESIQTTINVYGHIGARSQRIAVDSLTRILD